MESLRKKESNNKSSVTSVSDTNKMDSHTTSINDQLIESLFKGITKAYPDVVDPPVIITLSNNSKFGDYQCNSAMPLSKLLASKGEKMKNFCKH